MRPLLLLFVTAAFSAHAADSIFAPYDATATHSTACFEIQARKNIQIERMLWPAASGSNVIRIEYKTGGYSGFETASEPWIEVFDGVVYSAVGGAFLTPPLVLRQSTRIPAGGRVAFRISTTASFGFGSASSSSPWVENEDLELLGGAAVDGSVVIPDRRIWGIIEYSHFEPDPEPTPTPTPTPTPEPTPVPKPTLTVFGPSRVVTRRNALALQGSAPHARYVTATYKVRRKSGKRRPVMVASPVDAGGIFRIGVKPRGAATRVWLTAYGDEGTVSQSWSVRILPSAKAKKRR
jgi:Predicted solute binding protein